MNDRMLFDVLFNSDKNTYIGCIDRIKNAGLLRKKLLGIDGVSGEEYGVSPEANLEGLVEQMKSMPYRYKPFIRRRYQRPKSNA